MVGAFPRAGRAGTAERLSRSVGALSTAALSRMDRDLPWVAQLPAQERSWIGMIVQAGITSFVEWYRDPDSVSPLRSQVFGVAPSALAGVVTLEQTVTLVRLSIEVVEESVADVVGDEDAAEIRRAIDGYAREVAFATAEVYARAAEQRGAWDARLEALVVDSVLRGEVDETVESRAGALGWREVGEMLPVVGSVPRERERPIDDVRRVAHEHGRVCLCAIQGERLVVVLAAADGTPAEVPEPLVELFGPGPVVLGPRVRRLGEVGEATDQAFWALRAAPGWAGAPRVLPAADVLPERAVLGDQRALQELVTTVYLPLRDAGGSLLETVQAYLDQGGTLGACARSLFVHTNTVRYRLRRVSVVTGLSPTDPREAYTLRVALTVGRLLADHR